MNTTYGIGGALQSIGGNIMQMAFGNMQDKKIEERKKQAEEAQRLLEESRVARTSRPYMKKGDPKAFSPWMSQESKGYATPTGTPDQLMVSEYNSQGRPLGQRLADPAEKQGYEQEQQIQAASLAAAKSEAEAKMRDEDRKERDLDSKIKYRAAATSAANRSNLAEPGGSTRGRSEADLSKTVVNLMGDPDYMAAVNAGDPRVMQRMGAPDKIVDAMKSVATGLGVSLPEDTRTTIERDLQKETTPEGRAKIWEIFLREMDIAAAKGRASGKGIRAPREQSN